MGRRTIRPNVCLQRMGSEKLYHEFVVDTHEAFAFAYAFDPKLRFQCLFLKFLRIAGALTFVPS